MKPLELVILWTCVGCGGGNGTRETETVPTPPSLSSTNGVLDVTLTAQPTELTIGGHHLHGLTYNGSYIPPILRVQPGDTLRINEVNQLSDMTNLHYHGMQVSPQPGADDSFLMLDPGQSFQYEVPIPLNQARGMYWYHSHAMGKSEQQLFGGLSGALIVEGALDAYPQYASITQRVLLLKDLEVLKDATIGTASVEASGLRGSLRPSDDDDGDASETTLVRTVNGMANPTLLIAPGETQYWQIGNVGADAFYLLQLEGHHFFEVARDGKPHTQIIEEEQLLLPPSSRAEVLIVGGPAGRYKMQSLDYNTGPQGDDWPGFTAMTLVSQGATQTPLPMPVPAAQEDLSQRTIAHQRTFEFSETYNGDTFFINNQVFDPNRVDTTVKFGDTEEWTLLNNSGEQHVFHIHQTYFQVVEINGQAVPFTGYQDTITMPIQTSSGPGEVKVIIPFDTPVIIGKFMYHCHIAEHSDAGMMATIVVEP